MVINKGNEGSSPSSCTKILQPITPDISMLGFLMHHFSFPRADRL